MSNETATYAPKTYTVGTEDQRHIAVYLRVSSNKQHTISQRPDTSRWLAAFSNDEPVVHYEDKRSGSTFCGRRAWARLEANLDAGLVSKILIWRLDRLGRKSGQLVQLFDKLLQKNIPLVSVRDNLDFSTPTGRLMANIIASIAEYEREVIAERVVAGQERARAKGKTWGGSKAGHSLLSRHKERAIVTLFRDGMPLARIADTVGVARNTVKAVLTRNPLAQLPPLCEPQFTGE